MKLSTKITKNKYNKFTESTKQSTMAKIKSTKPKRKYKIKRQY